MDAGDWNDYFIYMLQINTTHHVEIIISMLIWHYNNVKKYRSHFTIVEKY